MSNLIDITDAPLLALWGETVRGRRIQGERLTLCVVELAPNAIVPEHRHEHEQLGMVITGEADFTVDGETRHLGPGGTWRCLSNRPHNVNAGPDGAVVLDIFTPTRDDWDDRAIIEGSVPRWPTAG
ncbi:MAG: cupin domain-containing protein [Chloroflexota bacterium]